MLYNGCSHYITVNMTADYLDEGEMDNTHFAVYAMQHIYILAMLDVCYVVFDDDSRFTTV